MPFDEITSNDIQKLIRNMKSTLRVTPEGVGLAAPQVGRSLRIFIVSEESEEINKTERQWRRDRIARNEGKPYEVRQWRYDVYINPAVKNRSRKKYEDAEGCLSVQGKYGTVERHEKITVEAYDERGKKFTRGATRFVARVIQHELDHLGGILFIDKVEEWIPVERHVRDDA